MFSPFCLLQRADSGGEGGDETGGVDLEGYVDAGCVGSAMSARNTRTSEADGLAATLEVRAEAAFELPAEPSSESATWDAVELVSVSAFAASRQARVASEPIRH